MDPSPETFWCDWCVNWAHYLFPPVVTRPKVRLNYQFEWKAAATFVEGCCAINVKLLLLVEGRKTVATFNGDNQILLLSHYDFFCFFFFRC